MGYDVIDFAPRVGTSGDDAYVFPGGTDLSGVLDTGNNSRVALGDPSGYSTVPSVAELEDPASLGPNQIIGLINRRIGGFKAAFPSQTYPTNFNTLSYMTSVRKVASTIPAMANAINAIRAAEGFPAFTFDPNPASNGRQISKFFAQCRKALRIAGISTRTRQGTNSATGIDITKYNLWTYFRKDSPWGTKASEIIQSTGIDISAGKHFVSSTDLRRLRLFYSIVVPPDWIGAPNAVYLEQNYAAGTTVSTLEGFDLELYSSNTPEWPRTVAGASNLDNLEDTIPTPATATQYQFDIDPTRFAAMAGNWFSMIMCTALEAAGGGVSTFSSNKASGYDAFNIVAGTNEFIVDFGT